MCTLPAYGFYRTETFMGKTKRLWVYLRVFIISSEPADRPTDLNKNTYVMALHIRPYTYRYLSKRAVQVYGRRNVPVDIFDK